MDKRSLEQFKQSLEEKRSDLQRRLDLANREDREPGLSESKDEGDLASASIASELTDAQQNQAENLLRAVNAALDRIDAGTFGNCVNCGQEIGAKRLEAISWAQYCLVCQELIDGR